jgi:uncharacterized protein YjdB
MLNKKNNLFGNFAFYLSLLFVLSGCPLEERSDPDIVPSIPSGPSNPSAPNNPSVPSSPSTPSNPSTILVSSITFNQESLFVNPDSSFQLIATVLPENAANKNLLWIWDNGIDEPMSLLEMENQSIWLSETGLAYVGLNVGAWVSPGYIGTITAYADDGSGVSASCSITVTGDVLVNSITLDQTNLTLGPGDTVTLHAVVNPADAVNTNITWASSNNNVATVTDGTITVSGSVHVGDTAIITAVAADGSGTIATCSVTVFFVLVNSITLDQTSLTLGPGGVVTLHAAVSPPDAYNTNITWNSSNNGIATVADGVVTICGSAHTGDTVTITAAAVDGSGKQASCTISIVNVADLRQIYYVSSTGYDNNTGVEASPLATVEKALALMQAAYTANGGSYWPKDTYNNPVSGQIIVSGEVSRGVVVTEASYPPIIIKGKGSGSNAGIIKPQGSIRQALKIDNGNKVTLGDNITITGGKGDWSTNSYGAGVYVGSDCVFEMTGNSLVTDNPFTGSETNGFGAGVYIHDNGIFYMKGNAGISNNGGTFTHVKGGGVYVANSAIFEMSENACISENHIGGPIYSGGAGVYVDHGSFTMKGNACISGNTITKNAGNSPDAFYGAGVFVNDGVFTMKENAVIEENTIYFNSTSNSLGGGVFVQGENSRVQISGSSIVRNNGSPNGSGGIAIFAGELQVFENALITANDRGIMGSGTSRIYVKGNSVISDNRIGIEIQPGSSLYVSESAVIKGLSSFTTGINTRGTVFMTGGLITGNEDGILVETGGYLI